MLTGKVSKAQLLRWVFYVTSIAASFMFGVRTEQLLSSLDASHGPLPAAAPGHSQLLHDFMLHDSPITGRMLMAGVDSPLLSSMKPHFSGITISTPVDMVQKTLAMDARTCDKLSMDSEGWPLRHPAEKRLIVASCGGVGTTYVMETLRSALQPYGYNTNCPEADMHAFKHSYPFADTTVGNRNAKIIPGLNALHCVEPDRILYIFSDLHEQMRSLYRRGFAACMGQLSFWDPSLYTQSHNREVREYDNMTSFIARAKYDVLGRNQHMMGWFNAPVPAPALFMDVATIFEEPHTLELFLGVPPGVLSHLRKAERTSRRSSNPPNHVFQQFFDNMNRQVALYDKHLVIPRGFVDRIRSVGALVQRSPYAVEALACPADRTERSELTHERVPLLVGPSMAHASLDDVLTYCGPDYRHNLMKYALFHNNALELLRGVRDGVMFAAEPLPKIVVWSCKSDAQRGCGGLADRLVGIASAFAFAMRYTRVFMVDAPGMSDVLPAPLFNYDFDASLVQGRSLHTYDLMNCDTILNDELCMWNREDPALDFSEDVVVFHSNRGAYGGRQQYPQLGELGLNPTISPACLMHSIFSPVPSLVQEVHAFRDELQDPSTTIVAVHFRMGDVSFVGNVEGQADANAAAELEARRSVFMQHYTSCIHNFTSMLQPSKPAIRLLITGDDVQVRAALHAHFSNISIMLLSKPAHIEPAIYEFRNQTLPGDMADVMRSAVLEWLLFSDADAHLMSAGSGFSRTAWAYSGKPFAVHVLQNYGKQLRTEGACSIQSLPQAAIHQSAAGL